MVNVLTDDNFKSTIESSKGKLLVDCFATWCGPCKMFSPILDELVKEVKEVKFYKLDVDENPNTSEEYQIMTIPTILIFEDGRLISQTSGFMTKDMVLELINGR